MRWSICAAAIGVALAGCVSAEEAITNAELGCGPNCPGNSPILGALGPYEFWMGSVGEAQPVSSRGWNVKPDSFHMANGTQIQDVNVVGVRLYGRIPFGAMLVELQPPDWVGVTWRMVHINVETAVISEFLFEITDHIAVTYYSPPGKLLPAMHGYKVRYQDLNPGPGELSSTDPWTQACPYTEYDDDAGLSLDWVVFSKGNRYNPDTGLFTHWGLGTGGTQVDRWVNMSCSGSADIKTLRAGVGHAVNRDASPELLQATLNMFMAKYCSTPRRYTELGQLIYWRGTPATTTGKNGAHEAIWNQNGAVCIDTPRLDDLDVDEIQCLPEACTAKQLENWQNHGLLRSTNPLVVNAKLPILPP